MYRDRGREDEGRRGINGKLRPADADDAILKDDAGNTYPIQLYYVGASPDGFFGGGTVDPGKTIHDVLLFESPLNGFEYLDLKLPYKTGDMQFRIDKSMVKMPGGKSGGKADKSASGGTRPVSVGGGTERKGGKETKPDPEVSKRIDELMEMITNADVGVDKKKHAVHELGTIGEDARKAIPLLAQVAQGNDYFGRALALQALANIGEEAVPELVKILRSLMSQLQSNNTQRQENAKTIIHLLKNMGKDAEGAIPTLLQVSSFSSRGGPRGFGSGAVSSDFGMTALTALQEINPNHEDVLKRTLVLISSPPTTRFPTAAQAAEYSKFHAALGILDASDTLPDKVIKPITQALSRNAVNPPLAMRLLGKAGPKAREAVPAIRQYLNGEHQREAEAALKLINGIGVKVAAGGGGGGE